MGRGMGRAHINHSWPGVRQTGLARRGRATKAGSLLRMGRITARDIAEQLGT